MDYKGYEIETFNPAGSSRTCMYSVVYCGDEVVFDTVDDAKRFIDEVEG